MKVTGSNKRAIRENVSYCVLMGILVVASFIVYSPATAADRNPGATKLSDFPMTLGAWAGTDISLSDDVLATLGARDYLKREYRCDDRSLILYITYFDSGSGALTHNPEKCYTGSGWAFLDKQVVEVPGTGRRVLRSTIVKGDARQLVLYWYQDGNRVIVSKWDHLSTVLSGALLGRDTHSYVASIAETTLSGDNVETLGRNSDFVEQVMAALANHSPQ